MIKVVAAIIEKDGKYLVCRRGAGGNCPFLWEFPGGKIEEGESPFDALAREIKEELCVEIKPEEIFDEYMFSYPEKDIYFYFIWAKITSGEIKLQFHSEAKWLERSEKPGLEFCPADVPVAKKIFGQK